MKRDPRNMEELLEQRHHTQLMQGWYVVTQDGGKQIDAAGEHSDPAIQFPQHGWLKEVNDLFPMTEDEKLGVANHRQ